MLEAHLKTGVNVARTLGGSPEGGQSLSSSRRRANRFRSGVRARGGAWPAAALALACLAAVPSGHARPQDAVVSITGGPAGETTSRDATFTFAPGPDGYAYATCELDGGGETTCSSPASYGGLALGAHRFMVRAYSSRGGLLGSDARSWTVVAEPPPPPPPPPPSIPPPPNVPVPAPVLPDFFLAAAPYAGPGKLAKPVKAVALKPGGKGSAAIAVVRIGASKGPLSYAFSSLPAGVTAAVSQDDVANPAVLTVTMSAAPAAKPASAQVTLTATPAAPLVGPAPRSIAIPYLVLEQYDLALSGIYVTQGIQLPLSAESALPARDPAKPGAKVPYPAATKLELVSTAPFAFSLKPLTGAAPLVRGKKTTVLVYGAVVAPAGGSFAGATVLLHGRGQDGKPLPYSPLSAQGSTVLSGGDPDAVHLGWLTTKKNAFTFTLPSSWTSKAWIELEAELVPPLLYGKAECSLAACLANNRFTLTGLALTDTGYLEVWPLGFASLDAGSPPLEPPAAVYAQATRALPLDEDDLRTGGEYRAYYDATKITNQKTLLATVKAFVGDLPTVCKSWLVNFRPTSCPDLVTGVRAGGIPGVSAGGENVYVPRPGINVVNQFRPLTSVAHELGHALGFRHADTACGGNDGDQDSESWWPDPWGLLYGISASGMLNGTGNVGSVGTQTSVSRYDFMSYCAETSGDSDSWISLINYRRAYDGILDVQKTRTGPGALRLLRAASEGAVLSVLGYLEGERVVVTRIRPKLGEPDLGPSAGRYRLVLRDGAGQALADVPMRVDHSDGHGAGTDLVSADVPLPGVSPGALPTGLYAVEVLRDGRVAARVVRSRNAPSVSVLAPTAGRAVGGRAPVVVRWSAGDADGDELSAAIDYSTDDGRTWRVVHAGLAGTSARLPSRLLTRSSRARLRVRVSDGLHEASATSGRFVSRGAAPFVRITSPAAGTRTDVSQPLLLEAEAYDDAFRALSGRSLTWYDGGRRIAIGTSATVAPRAPGVHRIRVVARDRLGRTASAAVALRVRAVAPRPLVRSVPARIPRQARVLRLRVASTLPAVLRASGPSLRGASPRWRIGRTARSIAIPVRPGRMPVVLALHATASGKSGTLRLRVPR